MHISDFEKIYDYRRVIQDNTILYYNIGAVGIILVSRTTLYYNVHTCDV